MTSACLFLLLWIGCWRSFVTANGPCVPEVRGEPFVQYVEKKNCDVDKKLLKLFNPVSFNESVTNNRTLNFMCTGFIDALNLTTDSTLESLCLYGLLSDIRDTDFCSNDRMMAVLEAVVENAVFDKISIIVANFTRHHCHVICNSSNELCWAFGITAKLVLKQSVTSTTPPTNATEPTAAPSTEVPIPDFFNDKTPHTSDVHNDNGDTSDTPVDETVPNKVSPVSGSIGDVQKPSEIGDTGEGTARTDANYDKQEILISPSNNDSQNLQNNVTINNDTTVNPTSTTPTSDSSTTVIANATVTAKPTTATSANTSESSSAQNVTTSEDYINEQDSSSQIPEGEDDAQDYGAEDTNKTGQDDQSDHDSSNHNSIIDLVDDDDDDDGYSYWHFATILLFILFLGVAGYLASHNRKKIRESVSTYMSKRKRKREYKPVNTMEAGLS